MWLPAFAPSVHPDTVRYALETEQFNCAKALRPLLTAGDRDGPDALTTVRFGYGKRTSSGEMVRSLRCSLVRPTGDLSGVIRESLRQR